jgi:hypothetical protein
MAGELWLGFVQAAVESSFGTVVTTATRRLYYEDPMLSIVRQPRPHKFANSRRDNQLALTVGPQEIGGTFKLPISADEIVELLLTALDGTVTPTQPDAGGNPTVYLWTFHAGSAVASMSVQWQDGARAWQAAGVISDKLQIQGSANGPTNVTSTLMGKSITSGTMTGAIAQRTPTFIEGWETKLYIDNFGATPGTTEIDGTLINWDITINNAAARKYFAANTNTLGALPLAPITVQATLTFEAAPSTTLTEFNDWNVTAATPTYRLVRIAMGHNALISGSYYRYVDIDLPGSWTGFDLGQADANTRVYRMTYDYVYDPTNAFGVQVKAENTRSAAW